MSSIDDTEAAINAAVDGPPPEESEVEEVESGADDGTAESEPILGKFKSQDDLVKAYQELERQFTQQRQAEPEVEEEPEQPFDVWGGLGSTMDEETERQVAARVYQDPAGMMRWAEHPETTAQFGPQITARVYATWQQFDPYGAARYAATKAAEEMVTQPRQELEQLQQQWFQQQHKAESGEATRWAETNLPEWDAYRPKVLELYEKYTQGDQDPRIQSFESITVYLKQLYAEARLDDFIAQQQEAAGAQPENAAGKKARTQTRSTATPNTDVPSEIEDFYADVLAGQPGRN
jgi:hypothetical protein